MIPSHNLIDNKKYLMEKSPEAHRNLASSEELGGISSCRSGSSTGGGGGGLGIGEYDEENDRYFRTKCISNDDVDFAKNEYLFSENDEHTLLPNGDFNSNTIVLNSGCYFLIMFRLLLMWLFEYFAKKDSEANLEISIFDQ